MQAPLPMSDVEVIFAKLYLIYGTRFTSSINGQNLEELRRHWAHELRGLSGDSVLYALENLPPTEFPPNVLQFRSLAQAAPRPADVLPALPAPDAHPERVAALLARLKASAEQSRPNAIACWRKVLANPRSTRTAKEMARDALQRLGASE